MQLHAAVIPGISLERAGKKLVTFMSTELADVPGDRQPGAGSPAQGRGGAFSLPVSTSFRFALLIAAVAASSFVVYESIYLATPRGPALKSLIDRCKSQALAHHPSGAIAYYNALHQAKVCYSAGYRAEAWWALLGVGVLIVAAGAIFLAQPWWYRRRKHLTEVTAAGAGDLVNRLEQVRQRAGTEPVVWLLQPLNPRLSAFAFGRPRRRFVVISGGTAVAAVRKPAAFDAVVLHELAHIKNRDIDQTYLALAIWRAFVVAALLPLAVLLILSGVGGEPQQQIWRVAVMALIVYALRNAILRAREFDADARVRQLDPQTALGAVLAGLPARTGRRARALGWRHPSGQERAAALLDPAPLYRFGFWDGLAIGLVAALGASVAQNNIVILLSTTAGVWALVPAIIFAALAGPALAVVVWRRRLLAGGADAVTGWAAGLGLGLGLAVGPVLALSVAGSSVLLPDHPSLAAFGALAVWTGLVVLIFAPFPVWIGHWADAWQRRADSIAPRVPARGAMVAAAVAAWAVLTVGLYLLLDNFILISGSTSAAADWQALPGSLRGTAIVITQAGSGWVVCLLVVGMPLAAAVAHRQWRPGDARRAAARRRRWAATALLGLAGCLTATALMVAVSAVAHARIAEAVRWSLDFLIGLSFFDEQAIVVIAVVCAVIVASRARSAVGVALSVVAGAAVAAVSGLALPEVRSMDHCFASLSIQYAHPPSGGCLTSPNTLALRQVVLGAALVSIVFVPAAYGAGMLLRRRIRRRRRPAGARALGWLAAAAAVAAAVTGAALWEPGASAQGIQPAGSIGRDGWIRGPGYDVRLIPNWYALGQGPRSGLISFTYPDGGRIRLQTLADLNPVQLADNRSNLIQLGAHPGVLDGAPGLFLARSGLPHGVLAQWTIVRGSLLYLIWVDRAPAWPQDSPYLQNAFTYMLHSWQWTS